MERQVRQVIGANCRNSREKQYGVLELGENNGDEVTCLGSGHILKVELVGLNDD